MSNRRLERQLEKLEGKLNKQSFFGGQWLKMAKDIDPEYDGTDAEAIGFCSDHWKSEAGEYKSPMAEND